VSIRSSVFTGIKRASRTPRLVFFAWLVNIGLALIVALPVFTMLDQYIGPTVYEDTLMERMDQNWWMTFKQDHAESPVAEMLDYSIMGSGPLLEHLETLLGGGLSAPLAGFLYDLFVRWDLHLSSMSLLLVLGVVSLLINALLSAGFIEAYRGDYPPTVAEFLSQGSRHAGAFIRLSLTVVFLQALLVYPILEGVSFLIASVTSTAASEMTPFLYYMGRNILAFVLLFIVMLSADYARVRIVVEQRSSSFAALVAGILFVARQPVVTVGVGILLLAFSLLAMLLFAVAEAFLPTDTAWLVLVLFGLQQVYLIGRQFIRASTYAAEVDVFQSSGIYS
jgi:hypothetical protein